MTRYSRVSRLAKGLAAVVVALSATFSSCTRVDKTLGNDLTPFDQGMKIGHRSIEGISPLGGANFETRLFRPDSILSSNLSEGFMGVMKSDTFGTRKAGFFTQYLPANLLEEEEFGYLPIYDSAMLYFYMTQSGGDTTLVQEFLVYEIVDDSFLTESADTLFYTHDILAAEKYIGDEPIFTFKFPDQDNGVYMESTQLRLYETEAGEEFVEKLMLLDGNDSYDYTIYTEPEEWVQYFKGLYITPKDGSLSAEASTGAIYGTYLESSGFGLWGRSRQEEDPTLIKDTVGMTYRFVLTYEDDYYGTIYPDAGNVSINNIEYDFTNSIVNEDLVKDSEDDVVPVSGTLYIEGMAGVVGEITMGEALFAEIEEILEDEYEESGELYTTLFFNQAMISIYLTEASGGTYDYESIDPFVITPWLDYMPERLGMYTDYQGGYGSDDLIGIADYSYSFEAYYGYTSYDYSGVLNRSLGCYEMNISSYLQDVWNGYLAAKEDAGGDVSMIDWSSIENRSLYLAPLADELFTIKYAILQGMADSENNAPIRMELTYTMIR